MVRSVSVNAFGLFMNDAYSSAIARIRGARHILLITHMSPDGDALGSLCFMMERLALLGIPFKAYTAGPLPETFSFLPGFESIITDKTRLDLGSFDLILSLDCGSVARTNLETEIAARRPDQFFLEIDHHPSVESKSDLAIRETDAASTTEILYRLTTAAGTKLTPELARCLLTGVLTDTGNFMFSSTSERTVAAAAQMLLGGASLTKIIDKTYRTKSLPDLKLWGVALSRLRHVKKYNITYTVITPEDFSATESDEEAMSGLAEFVSALPDVAAILVLREDGSGMLRGNLRTTRDDIDVGAIARLFGGGGHKKAAGFAVAGRLVELEGVWQVENNPISS